jgi:hypothetical protein
MLNRGVLLLLVVVVMTACSTASNTRQALSGGGPPAGSDDGPHFASAATAAAAAGFSIPSCPTVDHYNLEDANTVYGHLESALLIVHPLSNGAPDVTADLPGFDFDRRITVHGQAGNGYEYTGDGKPIAVSSSEYIKLPEEKTYVTWKESDVWLQMSSNSYGLDDLLALAEQCTLRA